jgi:hypothetical protein
MFSGEKKEVKMKCSDIFEKYEGKSVKIGGAVGFFYCGIANDAARRFTQRRSKEYVVSCNEKYNQLRGEISKLIGQRKKAKGADKKRIQKMIDDIQSSPDYIHGRDAKPLLTRSVVEEYMSITEPGTHICIIDSPIHGKFWSTEEFERNKTGIVFDDTEE